MIHRRLSTILHTLLVCQLLTACGGGGGGGGSSDPLPPAVSYSLSGRAQKGPLAVGSSIAVNELDGALSPTGRSFAVQTSNDLGAFTVTSGIQTSRVEIVGDGFYMDELTGQLASTRVVIRAIADLSVNAAPTVNLLTSLQAQRLRRLVAQGQSFTAADTQSRNEVLAFFGISAARVGGLSNLYSMQINGSTDADAVLLATSAIVSKMAANAALANSTSAPAELSNYISTMAAQIAEGGTVTSAAIAVARDAASAQINLAAVRTNVQTYYANRGVTLIAPRFEEWVDKSASRELPHRHVAVSGLTFTAVAAAEPGQPVTSNSVTIAGLGAGILTPALASEGVTLVKNGAAAGAATVLRDGDTLAVRLTARGFGQASPTAQVNVGSSSANWSVTARPLGGSVDGLTGSGLQLLLGDSVAVAVQPGANSFAFDNAIGIGGSYNVSLYRQPVGQYCAVAGGSGVVGTGVANIRVACVASGAVSLVKVSGDGQTVAQHIQIGEALAVAVAGGLGQPLVDADVVFRPVQGNAFQPKTVKTGPDGHAAWGGWLHVSGTHEVEATVAGISQPVKFSVTVTPTSHPYDGVYRCTYGTRTNSFPVKDGLIPTTGVWGGIGSNGQSGTLNEATGVVQVLQSSGLAGLVQFNGQITIDVRQVATVTGNFSPTTPWLCTRE